jgi:small subunit ribosomal protein S2
MDIVEEIKELVEEGKEAVEEVLEKAEGKKPKKKTSKKDKKESEEEPSEKNIEKLAELESTDKEKSLEEKKKALLEKVAKLKGKVSVDIPTSEELKEKVKGKKRTDMLIPLEDYVKSGIYLGTRVVTPNMRPFVYRRRADGLAIFNTDIIDEKIKEGIEFLNKFEPKDVIVICKRQAGWRVVEKFSEITGIRAFTKKYPAGILTNTDLPNFFENELTIITDHWLDKNALNDTQNVNKKVLMICDTNNFSKGSDQIVIGNNKSAKSLGVIFYLLARGYCKARKIDVDIPDLDWWVEEE